MILLHERIQYICCLRNGFAIAFLPFRAEQLVLDTLWTFRKILSPFHEAVVRLLGFIYLLVSQHTYQLSILTSQRTHSLLQFIKAFRTLPEDFQLVIAGEPYGSFETYGRLIDESGCKDRIFVFPEYVRDSEVKKYFSAADVTVLPYRSATQSGVSSVSYHFDVPMIVTNVGGLKETIGDHGTGIVADSAEPECIAREIERFFSDSELRENCIKNIEAERKRLSWSEFCKELINFAESL